MIMIITDNIDINDDDSFDNEIGNNDSGGDNKDGGDDPQEK